MMTKQDQAAAADKQRLEGRAAEHGSRADATQEATAAAAASDEMAAAQAAEPEAALDAGPGMDLDFGGPVEMDGMQEEAMDSAIGGPQPTFSDQGYGAGIKPLSCLA